MEKKNNGVVDSRTLHEQMNKERKAAGDPSIQAINSMGGVSSNNLARKDKSWSSVPDFFFKMFRKSDKKGDKK